MPGGVLSRPSAYDCAAWSPPMFLPWSRSARIRALTSIGRGAHRAARRSEEIISSFVSDWAQHGIGYWVVEHLGEVVGVAGVRSSILGGRDCWTLYCRFSPMLGAEVLAQKPHGRRSWLRASVTRLVRSSRGLDRITLPLKARADDRHESVRRVGWGWLRRIRRRPLHCLSRLTARASCCAPRGCSCSLFGERFSSGPPAAAISRAKRACRSERPVT